MNSPVSSTFATVSFRVVDENRTIGGSSEAIVKKECGARFGVPVASTVPTHAMGRGMRIDFTSRVVSRSPSCAGSNSVRCG